MIDALLGTIIASFASIALVIAITLSTKTIKESSKFPLTNTEKQLMKKYGFNENEIKIIEIDISNIELD